MIDESSHVITERDGVYMVESPKCVYPKGPYATKKIVRIATPIFDQSSVLPAHVGKECFECGGKLFAIDGRFYSTS